VPEAEDGKAVLMAALEVITAESLLHWSITSRGTRPLPRGRRLRWRRTRDRARWTSAKCEGRHKLSTESKDPGCLPSPWGSSPSGDGAIMRAMDIIYHPIGTVSSPVKDLVHPNEINAYPARLLLEQRFAPAVAALEVGRELLVIYHLHRIEPWDDGDMATLFVRRRPCRPNPIGVTRVRVTGLEGATITVEGLDAIDGTPILDIKPAR
jgi:tRNA (Thr-GGU) A37 N-methylase